MKDDIRFVGLDVHAETITVAVAEAAGGEVRELGTIPNREESIRKLMKKLGPTKTFHCCYEAGPTGYVLYWQLAGMGVPCFVVAPTLVPVRPGDRVKTDRRDAKKLARLYRSGELTPVWVPDQAHEALRDVVRAREAAKRDETRARHRLSKFLLRHGRRPGKKLTAWTVKYLEWVRSVRFEHAALEATLLDYLTEVDHMAERIVRVERAIDAAIEQMPATLKAVVAGLQAMRGVKKISAVSVVAELGPAGSHYLGPPHSHEHGPPGRVT
jgi:transposase